MTVRREVPAALAKIWGNLTSVRFTWDDQVRIVYISFSCLHRMLQNRSYAYGPNLHFLTPKLHAIQVPLVHPENPPL